MKDLLSRRLTPAERLWLWRRQKGFAQTAAASQLKYGRTSYARMEQGRALVKALRWLPLRPMTTRVRLRLARRRSGLTMAEVARRLGVSHVTAYKMERLGSAALSAFYADGCPENS